MQMLSRNGIGASEIAAVAGLNPYCSPWDVWLEKTGQAPPRDETEPMEWGMRLESAIRAKYADETRRAVEIPTHSIFHPEIGWARATPDGFVLDERQDHREALLQCKNVSTWVEKAWREAPPIYVQLQEQWELLVTGLQRADVAVLIGGNEFRVYTVHRDDKVISDLVDIATAFWRKVETRTQPDIDASDACRDHFTRQLTKATNVELAADPEIEGFMSEWYLLAKQSKAAKERIDVIRNVVLAELALAKADRLTSAHGTAAIVRRSAGVATHVEWKLVAELVATGANMPSAEFQALVAANTTTTTTEPKATLYAPRAWSKES